MLLPRMSTGLRRIRGYRSTGRRCPTRRRDGATAQPAAMRPDELERRLRVLLDALGPAPRAELLHVLMLPDLERINSRQPLGR